VFLLSSVGLGESLFGMPSDSLDLPSTFPNKCSYSSSSRHDSSSNATSHRGFGVGPFVSL
jgi:hypothetical protein